MHFTDLFVAAMLGHFVGDYLLQNQWMAIGKTREGWLGNKACSIHVILYTAAIALFISPHITWLFLLAVAIPHWLIDRTGFGWKFLKWKNGFDMRDSQDTIFGEVWRIAFAAPVYIMNDNTMHWICLWLAIKWFLPS